MKRIKVAARRLSVPASVPILLAAVLAGASAHGRAPGDHEILLTAGEAARGVVGRRLVKTEGPSINWQEVMTRLDRTAEVATGPGELAGNGGPSAEEVIRHIQRLGGNLQSRTLVCDIRPGKDALSIRVTGSGGMVLNSTFAYGSNEIKEIAVNRLLTTFYFGEEPNDLLMFNSELVDGCTPAVVLNTGDIGIGSWGATLRKADCCLR